MDPYIGKMLDDRYELLELIGSGGMANVYKAQCHRLNRLVAIKILKDDLASNSDFRKRFYEESLAVAKLSHTNIVSVYDVSKSEGTDYIVMELIDGITLKQYIERRGTMDWREALHFIIQIMRGLAHAHERGIIHRDIKPQNIMVLRDGTVKVADFGIAQLANAEQKKAKEALGSVHYMSPEQAAGDIIDARSDIYSAGVVLYEMLTKHVPFDGDDAIKVAIAHLSEKPKMPHEYNNEIPEALEQICLKAMCPDIVDRYETAEDMLDDLELFKRNPKVTFESLESGEAVLDEPTAFAPTAQAAILKDKSVKHKSTYKTIVEKIRKNQAAQLGLGVFGLILVLVVFISIISSFGTGSHVKSYEVPYVIGYTVEEALELKNVKDVFEIEVVGVKTVEGSEPGTIVEQDPTEGAIRKSNRVIQVYVCAEESSEKMPNVLGLSYQDAKMELTDLNLKLTVDKEVAYSNDYPIGEVIESFPKEGEELKKGMSVSLIVSSGPEEIEVPNFIGKTLDEAKDLAKAAGLSVGTPIVQNSMYAQDQVISQSLQSGTTVNGGTEIIFTISGSGVSGAQITVTFAIPHEFSNDKSVKVSFYMNDIFVFETTTSDDMISYTFTGDAGTKATVYAKYNSKVESDKQEIIFG